MTMSFGELYAIREKLVEVAAKVSQLCADKARIVSAPAHGGDLADAYGRRIEAAAQRYETRLAADLRGPRSALEAHSLDTDTAIYFQREQMLASIPAIIARLHPAAASGISGANRGEALRMVDKNLREVWAERDTLRQSLVYQKSNLGQLRQNAMHANDRNGRVEIERELRTLNEDLEALRASQDSLAQVASGAASARV